MSPAPTAGWSPTSAHLRAAALAALALVVGSLWRRPDLLAFGLPFLAAATWGAVHRPTGVPQLSASVDASTLFEGQRTTVRIEHTAPASAAGGVGATQEDGPSWDVLTVLFDPDPWTLPDATGAALAAPVDRGSMQLAVDVRTVRWGRRTLGFRRVVASSTLGAYRTGDLRLTPLRLTTLPLRENFVAVDAVPRPAGIVGLHRSRRVGDGTEFADVRPFRPGDRLRRVNWPVSLRTGELHVTSTWSDRDTEVMLLLDTEHDYGRSDGIDGAASSLDIAVRASASVAEHYLRHGDRVSLVDLGTRVRRVPPGSGRGHLRRILDVLVAAAPRQTRPTPDAHRPMRGPRSGALVVAMSPLTGEVALGQIARLVQGGHTVIVVDTLPATLLRSVADDNDATVWRLLAWRLRLAERQCEIDRLATLGVPVVRWLGSGSLDEVLRRASRVAARVR